MIILVSISSVLIFLGAFALIGVVPASKRAISIATEALQVMRDESLSDEQKEAAVQRASGRLIVSFLSIFARAAAALVISYVPILLADKMRLAAADDVMAFLMRVDVIVIITVVTILAYLLGSRLWTSK